MWNTVVVLTFHENAVRLPLLCVNILLMYLASKQVVHSCFRCETIEGRGKGVLWLARERRLSHGDNEGQQRERALEEWGGGKKIGRAILTR